MQTRKLLTGIIIGGCIIALVTSLWIKTDESVEFSEASIKESDPGPYPSNWFYEQRAYPGKIIPSELVRQAVNRAKADRTTAFDKNANTPTWVEAGPSNVAGRITDIAVDVSGPLVTTYVASAAGGVFKSVSTDGISDWVAVFDDMGTQSIGAVAIDPTNPDIVYVGTGEANLSGDSYDGTGIYKSTDGGTTWAFSGLGSSYRIGRIVVHPDDPNTIFVAVQGRWSNSQRGLFRSSDQGATWDKVLYLSSNSGCIDVALHPSTGTVLAAIWKNNQEGLYRSTDLGDTWVPLGIVNGLPNHGGDVSRIGVTIDPLSTTAYAVYRIYDDKETVQVYKSTDLGVNWNQTNDAAISGIGSGFAWYFGQIRVVPGRPEYVFVLGVQLYSSSNSGVTWNQTGSGLHVDHHALVPLYDGRIWGGCDGGVNYSPNFGGSWTETDSLPNTQFYAINIDRQFPERLYGGTQDNGTNRTLTGAVDDWDHILGGDGFYVNIDPRNSNILYAEYQNGVLRKSSSGGNSWGVIMSGVDYDNEPHNWNSPLVMDMANPDILYYGTDRVYKTDNKAINWVAISGSLTSGGSTVSTIDVALSDSQVVYAGTSNSRVWVTTNGGGSWAQINSGLPNRYITRVTVDPHDAAIAYVCLSGYTNPPVPHVYRTTNYGQSWTNINGDLPNAPVNDIIVDPLMSEQLFVGTDVGVYQTQNLGASWTFISSGVPIAVIDDMVFHETERILVAGTHGRSMFKTVIDCPDATGDGDGDGVGGVCDNCPDDYNPAQEDDDFDNTGNLCDNCPDIHNINQTDSDSDGIGDRCDNCPDVAGADQTDTDSDGVGDLCDKCPGYDDYSDSDGDSVPDGCDICPGYDDGADADGDGVPDGCDICPGFDDSADSDFDTVPDSCDNCPDMANPDQSDSDGNDVGDVCDYICGDANSDKGVNVGDAVYLINYVFKGGPAPDPNAAGDANCDGGVNVGDAVYLINYVFKGGPQPCAVCP